MKRIISLFFAIVFVLIPTSNIAYANDSNIFSRGSIVEFGSYPQSRVTDDELISQLESLDIQMESYGYMQYSEQSNPDSQYVIDMKYGDVEYQGDKYRRVYFTEYRSNIVNASLFNMYSTNQDDNGYDINTPYWFKWEPLKFRVLENNGQTALLMSESIIDTRAYIDDGNGERRWNRTGGLRQWLNGEFYDSAFDSEEKDNIALTKIDHEASKDPYGLFGIIEGEADTYDNIWAPSYTEMTTASYGFSEDYKVNDTARVAYPTDYSLCLGAPASSADSGAAGYQVRTICAYTSRSNGNCRVSASGRVSVISGNSDEISGVRPLLRYALDENYIGDIDAVQNDAVENYEYIFTELGATLRINDKSGLRFGFTVRRSDGKPIDFTKVEMGFVHKYYASETAVFTLENVDHSGNVVSTVAKNYVEENGTYRANLVFTGISKNVTTLPVGVRMYIKDGDEVFYSNSIVRSTKKVGDLVLADGGIEESVKAKVRELYY